MNPTPIGFDIWTAGFAFSAFAGGMAAIGLLCQKNRHAPFVWLGALVLLFSISIAEWVLWWTDYIRQFPQFARVSKPYPFFFGVLLLGYYQEAFPGAIKNAEGWRARFLNLPLRWHCVPGLLFVIKCLPPMVAHWGIHLPNWDEYTYIYLGHRTDVLLYPMFAHMLFYPMLIHRSYLPLLQKDPAMAAWHSWVIRTFTAVGLAYIVHHLLSISGWMNLKLDYLIAFFIVLFMGLIAWLGFVQPRILAGMSFLEAVLPIKYQKSALDSEAATALATRLQHLFEQEKTYLDPDLTLDALAKQLHLSRHHVSQAVNVVFGMGFPEWLAQWRVEEAKALLVAEKEPQLIIKEVAYAAGFNSKAAFNATFKKSTGLTPSAYRAVHGAQVRSIHS